MRKQTTLKPLIFCLTLAGTISSGIAQAQDISFRKATEDEAKIFGIQCSQATPFIADLNNDGIMDIYASGQTYEYFADRINESSGELGKWDWYDNLFLALSNGDGTYTTKDRDGGTGLPIYYGGLGSRAIDFDQDGNTDILLLSQSRGWTGQAQNKLLLIKNNGDGTFTVMGDDVLPATELDNSNYRPNEGNPLNCLSVADYNKDGYPDFIIQYNFNGRQVKLYKNLEGKGFEVQDINCIIPQSHGSLSFGDFNNDGWPDIVSVGYTDDNGNIMHFYRNTKDGNFELATTDFGSNGETEKWGFNEDAALFVLDYNQDGKADILCIGGVGGDKKGEKPYTQNGKRAVVLLNQSDGSQFAFEEKETNIYPSSGNSNRMSVLGDLNGDGWVDYLSYGWNRYDGVDWHLAISSSTGAYDAYDINDNAEGVNYAESWMNFGDLNGDGLIDLATLNSENYLGYSINTTAATEIQKPGIPTDVKAEYKADTKQMVVTWTGSQTASGSKAFYNLYLKNEDTGKMFMIVPADAQTGKQRAYTSFSQYIIPTTYTFENVEDGNYTVGVQAVTYSWQASTFATTPNTATINLVSANPADKAKVETMTTVTLTFDQPVTLNTADDAPEVSLKGQTAEAIAATASAVEGTDNQILLTLAEEAVTLDTYTLQIPEKLVLNANGDWNVAVTLTYTLTEKEVETTGYEPTGITPAEGETTALKDFVITFAENSFAVINAESQDQAYLIDSKDESKVDATLAAGGNANEIKITLAEEVTTAGSYTLVIPAKMIQESSEAEDGTVIDNAPELKFDFTIPNTATINLSSANPADKAEVETMTTVTLTFDQAVTLNTADDAPEVSLKGQTAEAIAATASAVEGTDNQILLTLAEEAATPDTYTLQIPEKLVLNANGDWNVAATLTYTLTGKKVETTGYEATGITPAEGETTALKDFVITFAENSFAVINAESQDQAYLIDNGDESKVNATLAAGGNTNEIKVTLAEEVSEPGSYTLVIPAKMIQESSKAEGGTVIDNAPELKFDFTINSGDGIDAILADQTKADVYTLSGVLVKKDAKAEDLKTLKKGIYIINGKKVILK